MKELRYTLLSGGSSDRVLMPVLDWLLRRHAPGQAFSSQWPDLRALPEPPQGLEERIIKCLDLAPCELLFVHRDAENLGHDERAGEIEEALERVESPPAVCVVPVRMIEDYSALRTVAAFQKLEEKTKAALMELDLTPT